MTFKDTYAPSARYNLSIPNGWYAVAYSHEIQNNQVKPLSILNKEYVLFRTSKGIPHVLEAYCPHQGTHLGYGGTVIDNCIICPFHHWRFNQEGKCVDIPYAKKIPPLERNCLVSLPTVEIQDIIYIYFHAKNNKPDFYLPDFANEFNEDLWTKPKHAVFFIKSHIHEFGENGFDIAHFLPVHHSEKNSITVINDVTEKVMKFNLKVVYPGAGMGLTLSKINVNTEWSFHGLGVFSNIVTLEAFPIVIRQHYCFTPQNNEQIMVRFSLSIKKSTLPNNFFMKWLLTKIINRQNVKMVLQNFNEDKPIWEHKIYRSNPVLCDGDGPILHYRRWAQQFYAEKGPLD